MLFENGPNDFFVHNVLRKYPGSHSRYNKQLQFFFLFLVFYGGGEGESKIIDEYPLYDEPVGFNKYRGMKVFMCLVI